MKKIRLDLDSLKVESFVTSEGGPSPAGTVFGMAATECDNTCEGIGDTCDPRQQGCQTGECNYTAAGALTCTGGPGASALCETAACSVPVTICDCPGTDPNVDDTCTHTCHTQQGPIPGGF